MSVLQKIKVLGEAASYDTVCGSPRSINRNKSITDSLSSCIYKSRSENYSCRLLKVLMTNRCSHDCKYCANRAQRQKTIAEFHPMELAQSFMIMQKQGLVDGLFLSSGIAGDAELATEKMLATVRSLRNEYQFKGYIHFKILPGSTRDQVNQAAQLSTRLSINIEAAGRSRLSEICSMKDYSSDILKRQLWIRQAADKVGRDYDIENSDFAAHSDCTAQPATGQTAKSSSDWSASHRPMPLGQTTQLIVGSCGESDLEILKTVDFELKTFNLRRFYFSAFSPVKDTPLENNAAAPLLREHRLYNVEFMLRKYKFRMDEFKEILDDKGMLPSCDPKVALANATLGGHVDINQAEYEELLRVPGIGPQTASRICNERRMHKIYKFEDLHKLGVAIERAKPFLKVNGNVQTRLGMFA
jgi:predicted DNA-binding helix-hairpin-helix protein